MTGSRTPPSCPWCANPPALGGWQVAEKFLPWVPVPHLCHSSQGEGAGKSRVALPAPDQASTQQSLIALFFVSAAQQLAQPPPGRATALGAVQPPQPGGWWALGSRNDLGILCNAGSGSWAIRENRQVLVHLPGNARPEGRWAQQRPGSSCCSALADTSGHSLCRAVLPAAPFPVFEPATSFRDGNTHQPFWSEQFGRAWPGAEWSVCSVPLVLTKPSTRGPIIT